MPRWTPQEKLAILERRRNVARRYVRGELQWEIAKAFEVDAGTISRDIKAIQEEWLKEAKSDIATLRMREVAKLDEIERCAWAAWLKSQENAETTKARMRGRDTDNAQTEKVTKGQAGDPRFLQIAITCSDKRCALLKLIPEPDKHKGSDSPPSLTFILQEENVSHDRGSSPGTPASDPETPQGTTELPPEQNAL